LLGAAWLAFAAAHGILQILAPRSVLSDPLLPVWARIGLLGSEGVSLAVLLGVAALAFLLLGRISTNLPSLLRPGIGVIRCLLATGLLLGLSLSWSTFWLSGQFLDRAGLEFTFSNFGPLLGYAARVHPFLVYGLPWILLTAALVLCEIFPRWYGSLPAALDAGVRRLAVAGLALSIAGAAVAEVAHRCADGMVTDPITGAAYSHHQLYQLRRDHHAGPLLHLVARGLEARDPFEADSAPVAAAELRRPRVSMEQYLSGVDREQVRKWNVIVVLVDSLRADQLKATGGRREVMPALEALAREGRVFSDCTTQASHTDYAVPAVFSSHYPLRARDVYRYPKDPAYPRVMIYDVLKALGWRTALYSSQDEDWRQMRNYLQTGGLDAYVHAKSGEASASDRPAFAGTRDDRVTISESLKWIESASDAPFFLCLNLQNSHLPYDVPADYARRFCTQEIDFKISVGWFPKDKADVVRDVYADSLAYVDTQLDRLFRHLKDRGIWDRTLVVVTGDHGEAFYEHGSAAHANGVYDEVVRVPLIVRAPGLEAERDGRPTQLIDVAPGIFHLLGLPLHPSFQGEDPFAPAPRADRTRYLISDTPWSTQLGVLRSGFKLIRDGGSGATVLYDLARDPGERVDASADHPETARELKARLSAWRRAQLDYYENALRQGSEYPPVLREP